MSNPLLKKKRVIAGKIETTPGMAITLTSGTDGIINAYDVEIDPDVSMNERMAEGAFGRLAGNVGTRAGSLKFKVEGVGSGSAGTAPAWALVCFESCAMGQASGVFSPLSAGSAQQTATFEVFEDGIMKKLVGASGTWDFEVTDGKISAFIFDYKGIWVAPSDVAMFTPQFSSVIPPAFTGATITVGAFSPKVSSVKVKYGNKVEMCEDASQLAGYYRSIATDRKVTGSLDPEATTIATYDAFGIWMAGTTAALTVTLGASGTGFTIAVPALQYQSIKEGDRTGKIVHNLDWLATQNGSTVDSEITVTF